MTIVSHHLAPPEKSSVFSGCCMGNSNGSSEETRGKLSTFSKHGAFIHMMGVQTTVKCRRSRSIEEGTFLPHCTSALLCPSPSPSPETPPALSRQFSRWLVCVKAFESKAFCPCPLCKGSPGSPGLKAQLAPQEGVGGEEKRRNHF